MNLFGQFIQQLAANPAAQNGSATLHAAGKLAGALVTMRAQAALAWLQAGVDGLGAIIAEAPSTTLLTAHQTHLSTCRSALLTALATATGARAALLASGGDPTLADLKVAPGLNLGSFDFGAILNDTSSAPAGVVSTNLSTLLNIEGALLAAGGDAARQAKGYLDSLISLGANASDWQRDVSLPFVLEVALGAYGQRNALLQLALAVGTAGRARQYLE